VLSQLGGSEAKGKELLKALEPMLKKTEQLGIPHDHHRLAAVLKVSEHLEKELSATQEALAALAKLVEGTGKGSKGGSNSNSSSNNNNEK